MSVCLSSRPAQGDATSGRSSDISIFQRDSVKEKKTTPSPMDSRSTVVPAPFSQYSARGSSHTDQNSSGSQLQASFFFCHAQSNGTYVSGTPPGSFHDTRDNGEPSCPRHVLVLTCKSQDPATRPIRAQSRACQIISCNCPVFRTHTHIFL